MSTSMLKGILRRAIGVAPDEKIVARKGIVSGGDGEPSMYHNSPTTVARVIDFISDTGDITYLSGDTGTASGLQAGTNGVWRLMQTPSATMAKTSAAAEEINSSSLQWKADQGPGKDGELRFAARVKLGSVSRTTNRLHVFAGFKDVASIEHPAYDTGGGIISASSDYVGFMFSPGGDTGWSAVAAAGVAGDSGDTTVALDTGVAANVYDYLEVVVRHSHGDTGGRATFFINGQPKGSIDSPVGSTTALVPCVSAWQQDTGSQYADVDIFEVSGLRDTGL